MNSLNLFLLIVFIFLLAVTLILLVSLIDYLSMSKAYKKKLEVLQVKDKNGLNNLQEKAKVDILKVFPDINFTLIGPEDERSYYAIINGFEIYLDERGLQIFKNSKEEIRWEVYDFDSVDQMVKAFTEELATRLSMIS